MIWLLVLIGFVISISLQWSLRRAIIQLGHQQTERPLPVVLASAPPVLPTPAPIAPLRPTVAVRFGKDLAHIEAQNRRPEITRVINGKGQLYQCSHQDPDGIWIYRPLYLRHH